MISRPYVRVLKTSLTILCIRGRLAVRYCAAAMFLPTLLSLNLSPHLCGECLIYRLQPRRPGAVSYSGALYYWKIYIAFEQFMQRANSFVSMSAQFLFTPHQLYVKSA